MAPEARTKAKTSLADMGKAVTVQVVTTKADTVAIKAVTDPWIAAHHTMVITAALARVRTIEATATEMIANNSRISSLNRAAATVIAISTKSQVYFTKKASQLTGRPFLIIAF